MIEKVCVYCYSLFFELPKEGEDICCDCLVRKESIDGVPMKKWLEGGLDDLLKKMKKEGDEECT